MYVNTSSFWQYKPFADIRRRFLQERLQTGVGSLKSTYLQFSLCYIFVSFRNIVGTTTTQRSRFMPAPKKMTLNDLECPVHGYNLKCALQTACLTYVCCGFRSWPCVTGWTWALAVRTKMWPMNSDFRAYDVCTNFRRFTADGATNRSWAAKLGFIHIMQHHLSDILICVAVCNVWYYESSLRLSSFRWPWKYLTFESFIGHGHVCRTVC